LYQKLLKSDNKVTVENVGDVFLRHSVNPVDYRVWGAMFEAYRKLKTKPKTIAEVDKALQVIWGNLPQGPIDKAVKLFKATKSTKGGYSDGAGGGHFEHSQ